MRSMTRSLCIALGALWAAGLVGCTSSQPSPTARQGFTACGEFPSGPVECQPGQYCADATFSRCEPGCTSDVNCAESQTCVKASGESVGDCVNTTVTPQPDAGTPPNGSVLEACRAACDHFQTCGLGAAETARCRTDCGSLTEEQQRAIGNCEETSCVSVTRCLGVDCLNDDDCSGGQSCVGFACL